MALPGVSFSPLNTSSPQGTSGQASPLQDAIKILSFRMPKVVGAATGSPLAGKLGDSVADNWLMNLFQGLLPEGNSPVPSAPGAPAAQPPFGFPSAPPSGSGAPGAPPPIVSGAQPPGPPPPSAPPPVVVFTPPGIPPVLGPPETPVPPPMPTGEPPVIPGTETLPTDIPYLTGLRGFGGSGFRWR